jgi:hypothetical protein
MEVGCDGRRGLDLRVHDYQEGSVNDGNEHDGEY